VSWEDPELVDSRATLECESSILHASLPSTGVRKRVGGEAEAYLGRTPGGVRRAERIPGAEKSGHAVSRNHDVELHWYRSAQDSAATRFPASTSKTDKITYERHGGKAATSATPSLPVDRPGKRIQELGKIRSSPVPIRRVLRCAPARCHGQVVNLMEAKYPFADNLSPVTKLSGILAREKPFGLPSLAWMFARLPCSIARNSCRLKRNLPVGPQLLDAIKDDKPLRQDIAALYGKLLGKKRDDRERRQVRAGDRGARSRI